MNEKKLLIDLTRRCNLHCPWCSMEFGGNPTNPQSVMNESSLDILISEIKKTPYPIYGLRGGEPLLYPGLLRMVIERIKNVQPDAFIFLVTNGTLFDRVIIDYLNAHNIPAVISLNASGYKGIDNFILNSACPEEIIPMIRDLKKHRIRLVLQRNESFALGVVLMHNIFPEAVIEVSFDFFQLKNWTEEDLDFLCSELCMAKKLAPKFSLWLKVMQGFRTSCSCADISRFYPDSKEIEIGVFEKKLCSAGCSFFKNELGNLLYSKYQNLCEEFNIGGID